MAGRRLQGGEWSERSPRADAMGVWPWVEDPALPNHCPAGRELSREEHSDLSLLLSCSLLAFSMGSTQGSQRAPLMESTVVSLLATGVGVGRKGQSGSRGGMENSHYTVITTFWVQVRDLCL